MEEMKNLTGKARSPVMRDGIPKLTMCAERCGGKVHTATWRQHRGRVEVGCGSEGQGTPDLHNLVGRHLWMLSDSKHDPQRIMGELPQEIISKEMGPKQESLWWTSTYAKETDVRVVFESLEQPGFHPL